MALFKVKRTKQGSSTLTQRKNTRTGKSSLTRATKAGQYTISRNLATGKVRKTKNY